MSWCFEYPNLFISKLQYNFHGWRLIAFCLCSLCYRNLAHKLPALSKEKIIALPKTETSEVRVAIGVFLETPLPGSRVATFPLYYHMVGNIHVEKKKSCPLIVFLRRLHSHKLNVVLWFWHTPTVSFWRFTVQLMVLFADAIDTSWERAKMV